jgi:DNA modification methylase
MTPSIAAVPVNAILHGDCVTLMSTIPAGSVDCILTDPPYMGRKAHPCENVR